MWKPCLFGVYQTCCSCVPFSCSGLVLSFCRLVLLVLVVVGSRRKSLQSLVYQGVVLSVRYFYQEQRWWLVAPELRLKMWKKRHHTVHVRTLFHASRCSSSPSPAGPPSSLMHLPARLSVCQAKPKWY